MMAAAERHAGTDRRSDLGDGAPCSRLGVAIWPALAGVDGAPITRAVAEPARASARRAAASRFAAFDALAARCRRRASSTSSSWRCQ